MSRVDWTVVEARKFADICKKHGLRTRVVRCRNTDSYTAVYKDNDPEFLSKFQAAKAEAKMSGWDGKYIKYSEGVRI